MIATDPRHGTHAGYVAGCRGSDCCWPAKSRYDKRRRHEFHTTGQRRRVPAIGYRRRVQALACLGWSLAALAAEVGMAPSSFAMPLYRGQWVSIDKHRRIAELYERLCMTQSTGPRVVQTKNYAKAGGWAPPMAWDDIDDPDEVPQLDAAVDDYLDDVAIERALTGDRTIRLSKDEKERATALWVHRGGSLRSLYLLTGWNVDRYKPKQEAA